MSEGEELSAFESFLSPEAVNDALLKADFDGGRMLEILASIANSETEPAKVRMVAAAQIRAIVIESAMNNGPAPKAELQLTATVQPALPPTNNSQGMLEESDVVDAEEEPPQGAAADGSPAEYEGPETERAERETGRRGARWRPPKDDRS